MVESKAYVDLAKFSYQFRPVSASGHILRHAPVNGEASFISTLDKKRFQTLELKRVYQLTETLFEQIDVPTSQTW